ncbi:MAG: hypothetical protein K9J16_03105 [Melioribacteraceae bacterium]|nr:hypothetical protein [Melioribacteraceae bacterium]MCF8353531.1 hypothetical protein [Melioribacteraceae bacterium]MCF8392535.1 hypothetical protein [Melioribacteraceae bacterium]
MHKPILKIFIMMLGVTNLINSQIKISLDGHWQFQSDSSIVLNIDNIDNHKNWAEVNVPGSWHLYSDELLDYQGIGWFKKVFTIDEIDQTKRFIIKFDAVDYLSELFINKKFAGKHEGGYTPFWFDITEFIDEGSNELLLRVNDPATTEEGTEGISYWHIPHGKQSWYIQTSGIWQSVNIFEKEKVFFNSIKVTPENSGRFSINLTLNNNHDSNLNRELLIKIVSPYKKTLYEEIYNIDSNEVTIEGKIDNPELWDIGKPNLYEVIAKIGDDVIEEKFGFREFIKKEGKFYLNGKPFYMISALDQNFYPETIYKSPGKDYIRNEMQKAVELGINTMRCHIKIPEKEYLDAADAIGILVWYEIPNWDLFNDGVKERARYTLHKMLSRDWNHPSLVVLSLINESWGIDLSKADQREWLINEFDYVKKKAAGRLIVDNSACWGNFHLKTDINDYHIYWAMPENYKKFSNQVKEINTRPKWLFSEYGDSHETGEEVLMISEFGNWGLPSLPDELPFWFAREFYDDWITLPAGVEKRFTDFKYDRIFQNYDELAEESQIAQTKALKYEIEEIRLAGEIQGYCVTEFTDINWEVNGLLDMWRNFKSNKEVMQMIQQPDVLIPRSQKYNFNCDEEINIDVFFSYYSGKKLSDLKLRWKADDYAAGEIAITEKIELTDVKNICTISFNIDELKHPEKVQIEFDLVDGETVIAENFIEVFVFPKSNVPDAAGDILVTSKIDSSVLEQIYNGKKVLCIADSSDAVPETFPFKIVSRESDWLDGNWASALNWYNPDHYVFQDLNFGKSFGFEAYEVIPGYVISDIAPEDFESVQAGLYIGWVHLNSGYMIEMKYGTGSILLTTFNLTNLDDPFAATLYENIIDYATSENFQPNYELKLRAGK